jgi:hypothetical protein
MIGEKRRGDGGEAFEPQERARKAADRSARRAAGGDFLGVYRISLFVRPARL